MLESCECREVFAEEAVPLPAVWRPHPAVWLPVEVASHCLLLCVRSMVPLPAVDLLAEGTASYIY